MINDDPLFNDFFNKFQTKASTNPFYKYRAEFIDGSNNVIPIHNVLGYNITADFNENYSSYFYLNVQVYRSIRIKIFQLNRKALKLRLFTIPTSISGKTSSITQTVVQLYHAYILSPKDEELSANTLPVTGMGVDDVHNLCELNIQLIEEGLLEYRDHYAGGIYRQVNLTDMLRGSMSRPIKSLSTSKEAGYDVSVTPSHNTKIFHQLPIPESVKLIDLPNHLQNSSTIGLYQDKVNSFLLNGHWYVYPATDNNSFNKVQKRLVIFNVPDRELMGLHKSHYIESGVLTVLCTGQTTHLDTIEQDLDNTGGVVNIPKAGDRLNHNNETVDGVTNVKPSSIKLSLDDRDGSVNRYTPVEEGYTSNPWKHVGEVKSKMGTKVSLMWDHSDHTLLIPGMQVKINYRSRGRINSVYGMLMGFQTNGLTHQKIVVDDKYYTRTMLHIFVKPTIGFK